MRLGLVLGAGQLSQDLLTHCEQLGVLKGVVFLSDPFLTKSSCPTFHAPIGHIGKIFNFFYEHKINTLTFCGSVPRPSLSQISPDALGVKWISKLGWRLMSGDDTLLSHIIKLVEEEGFNVVPPTQWLSSLDAPSGVMTQITPTESQWDDVNRGFEILKHLSQMDIGQALVIQEGLILGIEAIEGTKELIARCAAYQRSPGAILVKSIKEGQSLIIDRPTIGPDTIDQIKKAKFSGIAVRSPWTQIVDKETTIQRCNTEGLFLVGVP